jgi:UDP-N-acetylglucosamine--N-acetylmuramyl-(pentapeptide) pyrophosphoryl-undecaprenol N-acetylglucosamine transferase
VTALATGFEVVGTNYANAVVTGNRLRAAAHEAAEIPYPARTKYHPFNLTVFGGSQGARFFSECVPETLFRLSVEQKERLRLTMQARAEDAASVRGKLETLKIRGTVEEFFTDMPARIANSHLVICRSGASSVSELALIGRPSILVPLPGALDDDQGANAKLLDEAGGGVLVRQKDLSPEKLAEFLSYAMDTPEDLAMQAENARRTAIPDAAQLLADLVEKHAR